MLFRNYILTIVSTYRRPLKEKKPYCLNHTLLELAFLIYERTDKAQ